MEKNIHEEKIVINIEKLDPQILESIVIEDAVEMLGQCHCSCK